VSSHLTPAVLDSDPLTQGRKLVLATATTTGSPRVQAPRHERNHDGQERIDIPVQEGRMLQPAGFALEDPHTHRIRTHRLGV
jgi:hypothetical protein